LWPWRTSPLNFAVRIVGGALHHNFAYAVAMSPEPEQPPVAKRPRWALRIVLAIAGLLVVGVGLLFMIEGDRSGPETDDLKATFDALQAKWPDPKMRLGRRQLGPRDAIVTWFVSSQYVDQEKDERTALANAAIEIVRGSLPSSLVATHLCVVFAKEDHSLVSYGSLGAGVCQTR
jgi:hypothetical protein